MVVTNSALFGVGSGAGNRAGSIVRRVNPVGINSELVVQSFAIRVERQRHVLGLAVAVRERETHVGSTFPVVKKTRI